MDRSYSRIGLTNWIVITLAAVAVELLARLASSSAVEATAIFLALGSPIAFLGWFQMRLAAREDAEAAEMEDLARHRGDSSLFAESAADAFPARRARMSFERWIVPTATLLVFVGQVAGAWWIFHEFNAWDGTKTDQAALMAASLAGIGLVLLLLGLYSSKLARYAGVGLLRPSSAFLVLGALLCLAAAGTSIGVHAGYQSWDRYLTVVCAGVLALIAAETAFALVFEAYRPRVKGREERLIYESRLVGLLGQPAGLFSTAAQALDYQFGFRVSETWFYRFLERAFAWIVAAQLAVLVLSTTVVIIEPGEQALLERFGTRAGVLEPGFHVKLPWPIDTVERFNTRAIQSFNVGFESDPELERDNTVLWTRSHYRREFNLLVASRDQKTDGAESDQAVPVNFLTVSVPVQFTVTNVLEWAYGHATPARLLEQIANREVVRYLASVDIEKVMSYGRLEASQELRRRIQESAVAAKLGTEIVFIGLQDIHPPIGNKDQKVAASFEQVIGAEQESQSKILEAEGVADAVLPTARAAAARIVADAKAAAAVKVGDAAGRAARFENQLAALRVAPDVYPARNYLETLRTAVGASRKYVVVPTNSQQVVLFNLEDKLRKDITDLPLDPTKPAAATDKK
jgi:regulator of protease activity HflC (stomatin/prohibitin superfamily)